jgi:hypothetical protein
MEENFTNASKIFDKNELGKFIPTPSMSKYEKKTAAIRGILYLCILLSLVSNNMAYILIFIVLYVVINNVSQEYYGSEDVFMGRTTGKPSTTPSLTEATTTGIITTTKIPTTKDSIYGKHTLESNFDDKFYNNLLTLRNSSNVINPDFKYVNTNNAECVKPTINSPYMNDLPLSENKYEEHQPCLPNKNTNNLIKELTDNYISATDIYTPNFKNLSFNTIPIRNAEADKKFNKFVYSDMNPKDCIKNTFACDNMPAY